MDSFWKDIYDGGKDRRYGRLFFSTVLIAGGLTFLIATAAQNLTADQWKKIAAASLPAVFLAAAALGWIWIRDERRRRLDRLKYDALSRDEMAKARSKLKSPGPSVLKQRRSFRRTTLRKMDTNLKY